MAPNAHIAPSLLPLDVQRKLRGIIAERDLLRLCRDAARHEMRGGRYSPDDRADCASALMVAALADCDGSPPRATDRRYSLTAMCGRAKNYRRSLDSQRARDAADAAERADAEAWTVDPLAEHAERIAAERLTAGEAAKLAERAAARLDVAEIPGAVDLLARLARDVTGDAYAAERGEAAATVRQRERRAAKAIRARYPDAASLLRALAEINPRPRVDAMDGSTVWLIGYADESRPATTHGKTWSGRAVRDAAAEWRTGTAAGEYPARPADRDAADAACDLRRDNRYRPRPRPDAADALRAETDAIRKLGYALARR